MKKAMVISLVLTLIIPQLLFTALQSACVQPEEITTATDALIEEKPVPYIRVLKGGDILEMQLDDYVACVVLGEMPVSIEEEALKAQAVAVRTYTLRCIMRGNKHQNAHICTESSCCQAFVSLDDVSANMEGVEKVKKAVSDTAGEVITYQGNLIDATYFSCSGGKTEDAVAVWGASVPYLQSVDSPGEENAAKFESQQIFTVQTFKSKLGLPDNLFVSQNSIHIVHTAGGGVDSLTISGYNFSGVEVRSLLSLPSTNFTLTVFNEKIIIDTKGYGHRVGMSQYGAEAMAVEGKDYKEILAHYYVGTTLEKYTAQQMDAIFDKG